VIQASQDYKDQQDLQVSQDKLDLEALMEPKVQLGFLVTMVSQVSLVSKDLLALQVLLANLDRQVRMDSKAKKALLVVQDHPGQLVRQDLKGHKASQDGMDHLDL
jgi:hypothetical protein